MPTEHPKLSIAPMDKNAGDSLSFGWQGGGVEIYGSEVAFTDCNIYENTATEYVRAPPCTSPRWIVTDGPCVLCRLGV